MKAASLEGRILWRLALVAFIAAVLSGIGIFFSTSLALDRMRDRQLVQQAERFRTLLKGRSDAGIRSLPAAALARLGETEGGNTRLLLMTADGRVILAWPQEGAQAIARQLPGNRGDQFFGLSGEDGRPYDAYVTDFAGYRLAVLRGRSLWGREEGRLVREIVSASLWWMIPSLLIALWVGVVTVRRGLAPVAEIAAQAARVGPGGKAGHLPDHDLPAEIGHLVRAVNALLDRLQQGVESQRRFTAAAAHELRTPLAVLTARIEASDHPDREALLDDVRRMNRLVEQLLAAARLEGPVPAGENFAPLDLRRLAADTIAGMAPLAIRAGRNLSLTGHEGPLPVMGDRHALGMALENLLDNALKYGAGDIAVGLSTEEGQAVISVRDRGPGVAAGMHERIFERFTRAAQGGDGAGLGLAIVRLVARRHGGDAFSRPADEGALFIMRLPLRDVNGNAVQD